MARPMMGDALAGGREQRSKEPYRPRLGAAMQVRPAIPSPNCDPRALRQPASAHPATAFRLSARLRNP